MIKINFDPEGRAKLWMGELPGIAYVVSEVLEQNIEAKKQGDGDKRCVAIEVLQHLGGFYSYGLLGASFTPHSDSTLTIQVASSSNDGELVQWSLAGNIDTVRAGLPDEYTEGVWEGLSRAQPSHLLGSGVLRYDCSAHGQIGSSIHAFSRLAYVSAVLLSMKQSSDFEEELASILTRTT